MRSVGAVDQQLPSEPDATAGWRERAVCRGEDPETFFDPTRQWEARRICRSCPVREECLTAALEEERGLHATMRVGVRGGLTVAERVDLENPQGRRKSRQRGRGRTPAPCGTQAAWARHRRKGEPVDIRCAEAHEAYLAHDRERQARKRAVAQARAGSEPP